MKLIFRKKNYTAKFCFSNLHILVQASNDGDMYKHVPVGILNRENEDVALQPLSFCLHPS